MKSRKRVSRKVSQPLLQFSLTLARLLVLATLAGLFLVQSATAREYSFSWTANPEPVEGYRFYYKNGGEASPPFSGSDANEGISPIDIGNATSFTISGLVENTTYHFAVTAYNGSEESDYSELVSVYFTEIPLTAVIVADSQEGEAPFTVAFSASESTGEIANYTWSFGDGDQAVGVTASHTYQFAGSYSLSLTVTDATGDSQSSSISINVTEPLPLPPPPPPPTEPTAVISSSSTVGEVPYSVDFDGSGSTSEQPPILSYSWDFGEGITAVGSTVRHTFSEAGSYTTRLTVTDSVGLSGTATTPVLISAPPAVNQPPTAAFSVSQFSGTAPLMVSFDASQSNDADGSITSYHWSFGDDNSATGLICQHSFPMAGFYTVSLVVTDDLGETATASKTLEVLPATEESFYFELTEIQVDHNWRRYDFSESYLDPVVIASPPTSNDPQPATVRIRNLSSTGFELRIENWLSAGTTHAPETLNILVTERGSYTLRDGTKIEAGSVTVSNSFSTVNFAEAFSFAPVVLTQVKTANDATAVTSRLEKVSPDSFAIKLQRQEASLNSKRKVPLHKQLEEVDYIAWQVGLGEINSGGLLYVEAGPTSQHFDHNWAEVRFTDQFSSLPFFFAAMQTSNDQDPAAMRMKDAGNASVLLRVEEEMSYDAENIHGQEEVGFVVIGEAPK